MTKVQETSLEVWKDVAGYNGLYQVSNWGNLKSTNHYTFKEIVGKEVLIKGQILKCPINADGYKTIVFSGGGLKKKSNTVHLLVYKTFKNANIPKGWEVDHIDNNKLNNRLDNLQLIKCRQNSTKRSMNLHKTSRFTGVSWEGGRGKWQSHIRYNGGNYYLGRYDNEIDAAMAYQKALKEIEAGIFKKRERIKPLTSDFLGVSFHKEAQKWSARFQHRYIGLYNTEQEAANAIKEAEKAFADGTFEDKYPCKQQTSKYRGVSFNKSLNKWVANRNNRYLGIFKTEDEAYQATLSALNC